MDRKTWNRIGLAAAVLLVPGGFLLGGALAARRLRGTSAAETLPEGVAEARPAEGGDDGPP